MDRARETHGDIDDRPKPPFYPNGDRENHGELMTWEKKKEKTTALSKKEGRRAHVYKHNIMSQITIQ